MTGYRIYYSGAGDSGNLDVGASATEVTVVNRTAGVTYSITMVALSPHLPSPVVGPVNVTLGEYFTFEDIVLHMMDQGTLHHILLLSRIFYVCTIKVDTYMV